MQSYISFQNPQNLTNNPANPNPINDKLALLKSKISQQSQPNPSQVFQQTNNPNSNQTNQNFGNNQANNQQPTNNFVDQSQQTNNPNFGNALNQGFQNNQFQPVRIPPIQFQNPQNQQQFQNPNYSNQGFQNPNQTNNNPLPVEFALGFGNSPQQVQPQNQQAIQVQNYQQNQYPNQYGQYQEVEPIVEKEIKLNPIQQIMVNFKPFFGKFKIPILIGVGLIIVLVGGLIGFWSIYDCTDIVELTYGGFDGCFVDLGKSN